MKIKKSEFLQDPFKVARSLLGATLCSNAGGRFASGKIVELELYLGENDAACHASRGMTPRNAMMFEKGGVAYVYFVYGMHNMFNIVIGNKGQANAILIRALEPLQGLPNSCKVCNGPAKLTRALGITTEHNGADLTGDLIWIEPAKEKYEAAAGKRIGVDYAGDDANLPYRFIIKDSKFISKPIK